MGNSRDKGIVPRVQKQGRRVEVSQRPRDDDDDDFHGIQLVYAARHANQSPGMSRQMPPPLRELDLQLPIRLSLSLIPTSFHVDRLNMYGIIPW